MSLDERVSDLIKRIYTAQSVSTHWDRIALEVLELTGGVGALTSVTDLKRRDLSSYQAFGSESSRFAQGIDEYSARYIDDPSLKWASENPHARFCDSANTLGPAEYYNNDYVKWNLDRFGSTHWYVGYTPPADDLSFSFSVHFPAEQGAGNEHAVKLFRMLFDHMECAVRVRRRPFNPASARSLILLTADGRVQQLTTGAQSLLRRPGAIKIYKDHLVTSISGEQGKLDAALARTSSLIDTGASPSAVKIAHPQGLRPWLLTIRPLLESFGPFAQIRCELLVEIHDRIPRIGSLDMLQSLFDLTARELQVVRMLADGHSIESLAECMVISRHTARTHLRSIFSKTDTTRQSELLQLAAGLSRN